MAPFVTGVTPAAGVAIGNDEFVVFDVLAPVALRRVVITAAFVGFDVVEVVYTGSTLGGAFTQAYAGSEAQAVVVGLDSGFRFTVRRAPLWPASPEIEVFAVDVNGDEVVFTAAWPLTAPPIFITDPPRLLPEFPAVTGAPARCDAEAYPKAYFENVITKSMPESYLAPIRQNPNSGWEIYQAESAVAARVSLAVERFECGSFVMFAPAGARAEAEVEFTRPTAAAGAVTILAGTRVTTSAGDREFELLENVVFGALETGPKPARVVAIADGYEWNVPGARITAGGEFIPGSIDVFKALRTDPPYGDITFAVAQPADAVGGAAPMLEGLGADRGITRRPGESIDAYRLRIRTLPDTVSPAAIRRTVASILAPLGIGFDFIETWQIEYQTSFDAPSPNAGTPTYLNPLPPPPFNTDLFVYDDPRSDYPLQNVWLDDLEFRGAFVIVLQGATLWDCGFALDDPGTQPQDFRDIDTGRQRGTPALDIPLDVDPVFIYASTWSGYDIDYSATASALWRLLQEIKAAGVAALLERRFY